MKILEKSSAKAKQEILEAASIGVMISGGPAHTHMPMVLETIDGLQSRVLQAEDEVSIAGRFAAAIMRRSTCG